jgi:hypothetical protein
MMRRAVAIALLAAASCSSAHASPPRWRPAIELLGGVAFNAPTHLTVRQDGEAPISLTARYATRPLHFPLYYALRLGSRRAAPCWELQLAHHKLYLRNPPPEIESLQITHGFNLLTVNRALPWRRGTVRIGAGCAIPHVEGSVRGRQCASREYRVGGPAVLAGAGWRRALGRQLWLAGEIEAAAGWIDVPVTEGRIRASAIGLHLRAGLGIAP